MSHDVLGHPRQTGHGGDFWQNMIRWRREWQTASAFLPWEPHEQYEKAKRYNLKDEPPRLVDVQYATGEEQKNSSRRNEEAEPKWKQRPVVDVSGGESKVWFCKEQYCIGTWNVRSVKQGKLKMVKTGDSKSEHWHFRNQWTKMYWNGRSEFRWPLYLLLWQQSLRGNGVALIVDKRVWNAVLGCSLKNDIMIFVRFQGKSFDITRIQVYASTTNGKEAEVEKVYEYLQDLLELTPKKMSFSSWD